MWTYNKQVDTYQDTFELVVAISKASISFAREYKYTFWERIIDYSLDTITEVYLAKDEFKPEKKVDHINNALKSLALLDILWKTCWEIPNLSTNVYTEQMENIAKIKKHLKAWRDYCEKNTNK